MAYNGPSRGPGASGVKVTGTGWVVMIVILVVGGMMLFGKKGGAPAPSDAAATGTQAPAAAPRPNPHVQPNRDAVPIEPRQKKTAGNDGWSIEEVEVTGSKQPTAPPKTKSIPAPRAKVTKKGDWSIEEVEEKPGATGASLELREKAKAPTVTGEAKATTKGDWTIEEFENDTKPAGELRLTEPNEPKSTKKGDWELELD